ncbi:glycosyltransferase family 9 protein [Oxalobacteraceae bacterium R-40]|uniref:Glycosyltransferase family 9 protein n=1 Tax=Keguizhuia sedimenti TaxID=3064264 RepID=A0ABU1BS11_9BURK|nr:glycosyltransferase family 9 protein [Oxalobacteraceae bacterium R-40]
MYKTLVVHHRSGIGDLVWHVPYIRAIAENSANGKVTVLARPSCMAADLLAGEKCVEEVIEYDRRPRDKSRKGKHDSLVGQLRLSRELRKKKFDRIVIFSSRTRYGILALLAGIPLRLGFGFSAVERAFLNCPPYIKRFAGQGSWVYPEATNFAMAHRFTTQPIVPKLSVPASMLDEMSLQLAPMRRPRVALAIGASNREKNWGIENFAHLAEKLLERGCSILVLGGPAEKTVAERQFSSLAATRPQQVQVMCQPSVLRSAAALSGCDLCIGNDTGVLNMAVAVDLPAVGLFGHTLPLKHDPLLHGISGTDMANISVESIMKRLAELNLLAPELFAADK